MRQELLGGQTALRSSGTSVAPEDYIFFNGSGCGGRHPASPGICAGEQLRQEKA